EDQLLFEADFARRLSLERRAKKVAELSDHFFRRRRIVANQSGNRVQRVEEKVRPQTRLDVGQSCLREIDLEARGPAVAFPDGIMVDERLIGNQDRRIAEEVGRETDEETVDDRERQRRRDRKTENPAKARRDDGMEDDESEALNDMSRHQSKR